MHSQFSLSFHNINDHCAASSPLLRPEFRTGLTSRFAGGSELGREELLAGEGDGSGVEVEELRFITGSYHRCIIP